MIGVLMSGGMDSISIAWWKRPDIAFFVDYGQKASAAEESAGRAACDVMQIRHEVIRADCSMLGSGNMSDFAPHPMAPMPEWWPFRNQLILTLAGSAALRVGANQLMMGALKTDGEHADGRPEFIDAISRLMAMQEGCISVTAPAIRLT